MLRKARVTPRTGWVQVPATAPMALEIPRDEILDTPYLSHNPQLQFILLE